jgi:hypothetical protein
MVLRLLYVERVILIYFENVVRLHDVFACFNSYLLFEIFNQDFQEFKFGGINCLISLLFL